MLLLTLQSSAVLVSLNQVPTCQTVNVLNISMSFEPFQCFQFLWSPLYSVFFIKAVSILRIRCTGEKQQLQRLWQTTGWQPFPKRFRDSKIDQGTDKCDKKSVMCMSCVEHVPCPSKTFVVASRTTSPKSQANNTVLRRLLSVDNRESDNFSENN